MKLVMCRTAAVTAVMCLGAQAAQAAVALDRTRIIFPGGEKSVTVNIQNQNPKLPFLAQGWVEDEAGKKITTPILIVPPIQRLEAGAKGQVKLQDAGLAALPQDRESVYYFNLREIPPKSDKPNTLQLALQTRIKLFYRPAALAKAAADRQAAPFQEKITLTRSGDRYTVSNPTPYYVTLVRARARDEGEEAKGFSPAMVPPLGSITLDGSAAALGAKPVLSYVNDFGGQPSLVFSCTGAQCVVDADATKRARKA